MNEKEKLFEMIYAALEHESYTCEICQKMGYKCNVEIPDDFDKTDFVADFSKCDFKSRIYKTLTTQK